MINGLNLKMKINQSLGKMEPRYTEVSDFVNPNGDSLQKSADDYFDFLISSGEIKPQEGLGRR